MKIFQFNTYKVFLVIAGLLLTRCDEFKEVAPPSGSSITDLAASSDQLNILSAVLIKTGLAKTLDNSNAGSYTVFAPDDTAFVAYFRGALSQPSWNEVDVINYVNNTLSGTSATINTGLLVARLSAHIVSSPVMAADLTGNGQVFTTLITNTNAPARLSVSIVDEEVLLNANTAPNTGYSNAGSGAKVKTTDLVASNGVVHLIDKVMTSVSAPNVLNGLGYVTTATILPIVYATNPPTINGGNTPDGTASDYDVFSIALRKTGLCFTVYPNKSPLPDYTIFAPQDSSLQKYLSAYDPSVVSEATAQAFINSLTDGDENADPPVPPTDPTLTEFAELIKYHIVEGRVLSTDLSQDQIVSPLYENETFSVDLTSGVVLIDNSPAFNPKVVSPNVLTNAGLFHGLAGVLRLE